MQVSQNLIIMKIKIHATVKIGEDKTCNLHGSGKKVKATTSLPHITIAIPGIALQMSYFSLYYIFSLLHQ